MDEDIPVAFDKTYRQEKKQRQQRQVTKKAKKKTRGAVARGYDSRQTARWVSAGYTAAFRPKRPDISAPM